MGALMTTVKEEGWDEPKGELVLPLGEDQFTSFVASLLGKPQILRKSIKGVFHLKREDIANLFHLVDQRVKQQNAAQLIQFRVNVSYDDGSSVEVGSLLDFQQYNEVKPLRSVGVTLSWSYLIKFPDRKSPEKQEIDLHFNASPLGARGLVYEYEYALSDSPSLVAYFIRHTARTWGHDIDSLLDHAISSLLIPEAPTRAFVRKHREQIGGAFAFTFIAMHVIATYLLMGLFADAGRTMLLEIQQSSPADLDRNVLLFLSNYVIDGGWSQLMFVAVAALFVAVAIAITIWVTISSLAEAYPPSFVLMTQKAIELRNAVQRKYERSWHKLLLATIGALVMGVAGNYAYYVLASVFGIGP
jgi:hypothetical protein